MFCWRKTRKNLENLRVVEDWIELSSPVKNEKVLNATGVQPSWGWGQGVSNWIGKMETRTKDRGLKISESSLRISWKPMYSSDFKHGKNPFLLQLMLGAALQASNSEYQLCLVRDTKFQISAPDDVFWVTRIRSATYLLFGSIASDQGEIWRDFDEPIFKIFQNVQNYSTKVYCKLWLYYTIFKFVESKIKIRFCAPRFLHVWAISWEFSSRLKAEARMIIGEARTLSDFIWWKFNGKFNGTMWATWHV